jgi:hypothetical protein
MASSGFAIETTIASGQYCLIAPATVSVIWRFVASSSSRVGYVPSGRTVRGTPAVLITRSAPLMTS